MITRRKLSSFEFCRCISELTHYLENKKDLSEFIGDRPVDAIIDPSQLAFELVSTKSVNMLILRTAEMVNLSDLTIDQRLIDMLSQHYAKKNKEMQHLFNEIK